MQAGRCPGECQELLGSCCSFLDMHIKNNNNNKNVIQLDNLEIARLQNKGSSVHFSKSSLVFVSCLYKYTDLS